jgi:rubrerythrin
VLVIEGEDPAHRSQVAAAVEEADGAAKPTFDCSVCGYGIARSTPPERCPMCQGQDAWLYSSRRPFAHA